MRPNFLIVGAPKCGTSALASILGAHPDCCVSEPKEVRYFSEYYDRGEEWYRTAFSHYNGEPVVGDATPEYVCRSIYPEVVARIQAFDPSMKLILMVRDPLARLISEWQMHYRAGIDQGKVNILWEWALKGFEEYNRRPKARIHWDKSRYLFQLEWFEEYFHPEQIHVVFLEDMAARKEKEVAKAMEFLNLDSRKWDRAFQERRNSAKDNRVRPPVMRKLQASLPYKVFVRLLPSSFRDKYRARITRKVIKIPEVEPDSKMAREYRDYVRDDARAFLKRFGKPVDFWPSIGP